MADGSDKQECAWHQTFSSKYGFKKEYLKKYLDDRANREINNGNIKSLSPVLI
jgi:hypothetical protein